MLVGLGRHVHMNVCNPAVVDAGADCRSILLPVAPAIIVDGDRIAGGHFSFQLFQFYEPAVLPEYWGRVGKQYF